MEYNIYNVKRFDKNSNEGLSTDEVNERFKQGLVNYDSSIKTKSIKKIIFDRSFTFLNIINIVFVFLIIFAGFADKISLIDTLKNITFMGVILSNTFIGTIQEIRSKKIIDKLSLISVPTSTAVRDGVKTNISINEIVLDDILYLKLGDQITTDSIVIEGEIEVNESLISGESDPVIKNVNSNLLSGSFVLSGNAYVKVIKVAEHNYANKITNGAKYLKKSNSKIVKYLDFIVKAVSFLLIPLGILLFSKQYFISGDSLSSATFSTVASLIAMIPEGLILLTSLVFVLSVMRLAKHRTLVQELYCTETLARVDVLCMDKTGTITEGVIQVKEIISFDNFEVNDILVAMTALTTSINDENATFNAIKEYCVNRDVNLISKVTVPFSSARKWSGASFENENSYILGAGEIILKEKFEKYKIISEKYIKTGHRNLFLAKSEELIKDKELPSNIIPMGIVVLSDKIRDDAKETLEYFNNQGIELKIISGDNALTVSNISEKVAVKNFDKYIDLSSIDVINYDKICEEYNVFGRVNPSQKLNLIKSLKKNGHTVAMVGDGVNDVLALKEADCSVAMSSGSDAARTVSDLVLLDSKFSSVPLAFKEGRRSINNLQRSASLYLNKTVYAIILSFVFLIVSNSYPFQPIQLTLISATTIGVPSFILALEKNKSGIRGDFLYNVLRVSVPISISVVFNILILCVLEYQINLSYDEFSNLAMIITAFCGLVLLLKLSLPLTRLRTVLCLSMLSVFLIGIIVFNKLFSVVKFNLPMFVILICLMIFTLMLTSVINYFFSKTKFLSEEKIMSKFKKKEK